jgi:hypothetical protein
MLRVEAQRSIAGIILSRKTEMPCSIPIAAVVHARHHEEAVAVLQLTAFDRRGIALDGVVVALAGDWGHGRVAQAMYVDELAVGIR